MKWGAAAPAPSPPALPDPPAGPGARRPTRADPDGGRSRIIARRITPCPSPQPRQHTHRQHTHRDGASLGTRNHSLLRAPRHRRGGWMHRVHILYGAAGTLAATPSPQCASMAQAIRQRVLPCWRGNVRPPQMRRRPTPDCPACPVFWMRPRTVAAAGDCFRPDNRLSDGEMTVPAKARKLQTTQGSWVIHQARGRSVKIPRRNSPPRTTMSGASLSQLLHA